MSYVDDNAELNALRDQYPLGTLEMETTDGRRWHRRVDVESENYFVRYSQDWSRNRELLVDFKRLVDEFGTYVGVAYPIISNFISDMYYHNPDPFIQDKGGDRDLSKILTDVIRSIHAECDTEREFRDAFLDQAWASFGVIGGTFQQYPANAGEPTPAGGIVEPTEQRVLLRRISPWRIRWDPRGRRWDLADHLWVGFDTYELLGPLMRDPRLNNDDKARLIAHHGQKGITFANDELNTTLTGEIETDPEHIRVAMRTIWDRTTKLIYRKPYGAKFTFTPQPWDEEWARADFGAGMFPVHYMPRNRVPENKQNTEGFIGLADMTLIREHILNINKAQGLLVNALGRAIDVYLTVKGAMEAMQTKSFEDAGRLWKIVSIDPDALNKFPSTQDGKLQMKDVLTLVETGESKDLQHMAFIDHEFSLIQQIIGQGPGDRGGVSESDSATESLGQQQGLARRMAVNRNDAGKHYNAGSKMIFIMIQSRRTLPLRYQMTTRFNERTWATFANPREQLKNIDVHFDYATGSTEPRTRESEFALRERMANILMPIFQAQQNWRMCLKVAEDLIEPLNLMNTEQYFSDEATAIVMQLLTLMRALAVGSLGGQEITADNEVVTQQIPELITALAQAILTPAQLAQVEATVQGVDVPDDAGEGGTGSLPKPPSPGEATSNAARSGMAAAGIVGGIQSQA